MKNVCVHSTYKKIIALLFCMVIAKTHAMEVNQLEEEQESDHMYQENKQAPYVSQYPQLDQMLAEGKYGSVQLGIRMALQNKTTAPSMVTWLKHIAFIKGDIVVLYECARSIFLSDMPDEDSVKTALIALGLMILRAEQDEACLKLFPQYNGEGIANTLRKKGLYWIQRVSLNTENQKFSFDNILEIIKKWMAIHTEHAHYPNPAAVESWQNTRSSYWSSNSGIVFKDAKEIRADACNHVAHKSKLETVRNQVKNIFINQYENKNYTWELFLNNQNPDDIQEQEAEQKINNNQENEEK